MWISWGAKSECQVMVTTWNQCLARLNLPFWWQNHGCWICWQQSLPRNWHNWLAAGDHRAQSLKAMAWDCVTKNTKQGCRAISSCRYSIGLCSKPSVAFAHQVQVPTAQQNKARCKQEQFAENRRKPQKTAHASSGQAKQFSPAHK